MPKLCSCPKEDYLVNIIIGLGAFSFLSIIGFIYIFFIRLTRKNSTENLINLGVIATQKMVNGNLEIEAIAEYDEIGAESTHYYEVVDYNQIQKSRQSDLYEEMKSKPAEESVYETPIKIPKEEEIHYMELNDAQPVAEENPYMAMDQFKTKNLK